MGLLSPEAERLLAILTPEPVPLTLPQYTRSQVRELERLGLVEVRGWSDTLSICLSEAGRSLRHQVNN